MLFSPCPMLVANALIAAITLLLFVLWFRYMCSMMLAAQTSLDRSIEVAQSNSLLFADVLRELFAAGPVSRETLDMQERALHRDLEILDYLLRHMGQTAIGDSSIEVWMLKSDFHIQSVCYRILRKHSPLRARGHVHQMAAILSHFANTVGERTAPAR
jgi:hypothetical protein